MPRTPGSKNKQKPITEAFEGMTNEDIFLAELIAGKAKWTKIADELKNAGKACINELEYANAYKILINRFTQEENVNPV